MAEEGTLCINADVEKFSGANADSTADAEAYTNVYIKMAEGYVCSITRFDWVTNYSDVSTIGKELLRRVTAALAAIDVINYQMNGYTSRTESQTMLDVLYGIVVDIINILLEDDVKTFVTDGTV